MEFVRIEEELAARKFKKSLEREIEDYFESKAFNLIEPDIFQSYDDFLLSNFRHDTSKTVKVLSGNSTIYTLRPDITLNILGKVFSSWEGNEPLKVYYNSKIYSNSPNGGIIQNHQVGVESLGEESLEADKEIFEMAVYLLDELKTPYTIELGSSVYLDSYIKELNLDLKDENEIRALISNKNKHELLKLLKKLGIEGILEVVLDMEGNIEDVIKMARNCYVNSDMKNALDYLESLIEFFNEKNLIEKINVDLSMIPDLDYYDGIVFKGYCQGTSKRIISGGRYDKLTERFGSKVPAVGFMIDMDMATRLKYREGNQ